MSPSKIRVEGIDSGRKIIRITPKEGFNPRSDLHLFEEIVANLIKVRDVHLVIDLANVAYPSTSFIAYLVEVTSFLRRHGGDIKLINLSNTARANFLSFNVLGYLSLLESQDDLAGFVAEKEQQQNGGHSSRSAPEASAGQGGEPAGTEAEHVSVEELLNLDIRDDSAKNSESKDLGLPDLEEIVDEPPDRIRMPQSEKIVVHSREDQLYKLTDFVEIMARRAGIEESEIARIKISVYEAAHNIIEHAYEFNPNHHIQMVVRFDSDKFEIILLDRGKGFDYDPNRDYDAIEAAEERRTGGFGLHIIRRSMDDVIYECNPRMGNKLTLVKKLH